MTTMIRRGLPLLLLPLALLVAGCGLLPPSLTGLVTGGGAATPAPSGAATTIEAARAAWAAAGVRSYTWTLAYGCECAINGPVTVTVVEGKVTDARDAQGAPVDLQVFGAFPMTVDALWDSAAGAIDGGGTVTITPGSGGVPAAVNLDPIPEAIDDELFVKVVSFLPAG